MIELTTYEEYLIQKNLPPHLAVLKSKYPNAVSNAASTQNLPSLPSEYEPDTIDIYYGDEGNSDDLPSISFEKGKLNFIHLTEQCKGNPVIQIEIDGEWSYIEVEKQVLLDRMNNVQLPEVEITEEAILKTCSLLEDR